MARSFTPRAANPIVGGLLFFLVLFLSACAGPGPRIDYSSTGLPSTKELVDTPFFPQQRYQCGPAALSTVLNSSSKSVSPDTLVGQVYVPKRKGSLRTEMISTTRRYERIAYQLDPDLLSVLTEVVNGRPVLVMQNLGIRLIPKWHYAVVVGYDLNKSQIILRSGLDKRKVYSLKLFDRTWRRSGRWAVVIVSTTELPATANEHKYLKSILPFERTKNWEIANQAYLTASQKWSRSLGAHMGLGNTYYHLAESSQAEKAYRKTIALDQEHAPAHNNLAQVLLDKNKLDEALLHARRAVELGGAYSVTYSKTLKDIEKRIGQN